VERAVSTPSPLETALGALGLAAALFGRGVLRTLGAATAAAVLVRYVSRA
jgi:hypothetical protein